MSAAELLRALVRLPARALAFLVVVYQWTIRPLIGPNCRFTPTCSDYAITALRTHGAVRGGYLGARRILRCNPWHPGGHDPVPDLDCACHTNFRKPAR